MAGIQQSIHTPFDDEKIMSRGVIAMFALPYHHMFIARCDDHHQQEGSAYIYRRVEGRQELIHKAFNAMLSKNMLIPES